MRIKSHYFEELVLEPLRHYFSFFFFICILNWSLRIYEWVHSVAAKQVGPKLQVLELKGFGYDFIFSLQVAGAILPIYGFFQFLSYSSGKGFKIIFEVLMALVLISISQYYITATVPLGSDFWGYSIDDIKTTVAASTGLDLIMLGLFAVFILLPFLWEGIYARLHFRNQFVPIVFLVAMISALVLQNFIMPFNKDFNKEAEFYVVENKGHYFATKSIELLIQKQLATQTPLLAANHLNGEYPLMHKMNYRDVLGPYLNKADSLPNIVFIMVEGLGKSFVGDNAPNGGFTPFLDSLSRESLHWDNFLSSAGRTFGVLPSIFGSLPFHENGFMELKNRMPSHVSLISLLKGSGYRSTYYYGGNANFDQQDLFLEAQGIDLIVSEKSFPSNYQKMKPNSGGFTWGYGDKDVFKRALELKDRQNAAISMDIFMTLTTHEPFKVPEDSYHQRFDQMTSGSKISPDILKEFRGVFECLLYTDDAIKNFINEYRKRPEFERTIFVITGDHRMIPVPHKNSIDRFHVPFIVWSPLLKGGKKFKSIGTHHNIAATFLAYLNKNYDVPVPQELPFLGDVLDANTSFSSSVNQAIMRNKGDLSCYVMGEYFLSDGAVFKISDNMELSRSREEKIESEITARLAEFSRINLDVCDKNKLYNGNQNVVRAGAYNLNEKQLAFLKESGIGALGVDDQFFKARDLAFAGKYEQSRTVLQNILNGSPNYSDVRILLGRTYSWQGQYDLSRKELKEAIRRSPNYYDAYLALIDCELYSDRPDSAFYWYNQGIMNADDTLEFKPKKIAIRDAKKKAQS